MLRHLFRGTVIFLLFEALYCSFHVFNAHLQARGTRDFLVKKNCDPSAAVLPYPIFVNLLTK